MKLEDRTSRQRNKKNAETELRTAKKSTRPQLESLSKTAFFTDSFAKQRRKMKRIILISIIILFLCPMALAGDRSINELPMYGGQHDPQVKPDLESSQRVAKLGWQYFYKGDLNTAIKRFNQAWMFNRNNIDALWGFGLIMGRRSDEEKPEYHIRESIRFLEMAVSLQTNNPNILADLGYSYTALGVLLDEKKDPSAKDAFSNALLFYEKAMKLSPDLPPLHSNWSVLEFYQGNYQAARDRLDKAKRLGFEPDPDYEKKLNNKLKNSVQAD